VNAHAVAGGRACLPAAASGALQPHQITCASGALSEKASAAGRCGRAVVASHRVNGNRDGAYIVLGIHAARLALLRVEVARRIVP
jgi:hypothetical protein